VYAINLYADAALPIRPGSILAGRPVLRAADHGHNENTASGMGRSGIDEG
jgi:hypothetical protein